MIRKFHNCAKEVFARHPKVGQGILAVAYTVGDTIVLATPAVERGFFNHLRAGQADWPLLAAAYLERPLPFAISCVFVGSSLVIAKSFSKAHAGQLVGVSMLMYDLKRHGQTATALSFIPAVAGCLAGAFYAPLERKFSHAQNFIIRETLGKPKRLAGALFLVGNVPVFLSALFSEPHNLVMLSAAASWVIGNGISMLLPKDRANLLEIGPALPSHSPQVKGSASPTL